MKRFQKIPGDIIDKKLLKSIELSSTISNLPTVSFGIALPKRGTTYRKQAANRDSNTARTTSHNEWNIPADHSS